MELISTTSLKLNSADFSSLCFCISLFLTEHKELSGTYQFSVLESLNRAFQNCSEYQLNIKECTI